MSSAPSQRKRNDPLHYRLVVPGQPDDTFAVVRFQGTEQLSQLYHFVIELVSEQPPETLSALLNVGCRLDFCYGDTAIKHYHGLLAALDYRGSLRAGLFYYQARLMPRLWLLQTQVHSQVFLDQAIDAIVDTVLTDEQLTQNEIDYQLLLTGAYPKKAMSCQYNETAWAHLCRRLEHWGLWFSFDQSGDQREKLIISDNPQAHQPIAWPADGCLYYTPQQDQDNQQHNEQHKAHPEEDSNNPEQARNTIDYWCCHFKPLPNRLLLKDHSYENPQLVIEERTVVAQQGYGEHCYYGEHLDTRAEGQQLAKVRAEALRCQAASYQGRSAAPGLQAGYLFTLKEQHGSDTAAPSRYLVTEVQHQGNQAAYIAQRFGWLIEDDSPVYRNQFRCIDSTVPYRPPKQTTIPKCTNVLLASIDAGGVGLYPELDNQGRYKVILPFDLSGRAGGKASCWLPLAVPYAGSDHGMHLPLHKGATVLLGCIDGHLDRWLIQGALTNTANPSVVNEHNQTVGAIHTAAGNQVKFDDKHEFIFMTTHQGKLKQAAEKVVLGRQAKKPPLLQVGAIAPTQESSHHAAVNKAKKHGWRNTKPKKSKWPIKDPLRLRRKPEEEKIAEKRSLRINSADGELRTIAKETHCKIIRETTAMQVGKALQVQVGGMLSVRSRQGTLTEKGRQFSINPLIRSEIIKSRVTRDESRLTLHVLLTQAVRKQSYTGTTDTTVALQQLAVLARQVNQIRRMSAIKVQQLNVALQILETTRARTIKTLNHLALDVIWIRRVNNLLINFKVVIYTYLVNITRNKMANKSFQTTGLFISGITLIG